MTDYNGMTHERWRHELFTYHEWIKKGYSVVNGQFNNIRYRLHDGDVSVPLYERHQVVSTMTGVVKEVVKPEYDSDGPTI